MRSRAAIASHPIHPILVSFPIGLWITALVLDLIGISRGVATLWAAGFYCVIAGCVGAVLAAIPGALDWFTVVPPQSSAKRRGLLHGSINVAALLLYIYIAFRQGICAVQTRRDDDVPAGRGSSDARDLRLAGRNAGLSQPDWC